LAVVTPIAIEGFKQVQAEPAEILLVISQQLANSSIPPFVNKDKDIFTFTIVADILFFFSMSLSLYAAVNATSLFYQVIKCGREIEGISSEDRALKRWVYNTRILDETEEWIHSLSLLARFAFSFFYLGFMSWIGTLGSSTLTMIIYTPPVLTIIIALVRLGWHIMGEMVRSRVSKKINQIQRVMKISLSEGWFGSWSISSKIRGNNNPNIARMECLVWLLRSIDPTSNQRSSLLSVVRTITELPAWVLMEENPLEDAQWSYIFTYLCEPYFGKVDSTEYTPEELEDAGFLCRAISMTCNTNDAPEFKKFFRSLQNGTNSAISAGAYLADHRRLWWNNVSDGLKVLETGFIHACRARKDLPSNYFDFFLLNIRYTQSQVRYSLSNATIMELALTCSTSQRLFDASSDDLISVDSINTLCDILTCQMGGTVTDQGTAMTRYVSVMESQEPDKVGDPLIRIFYAILNQIIARVAQVDLEATDSWEDKLDPSLDLLCVILNSTITLIHSRDLADILYLIVRFPASDIPIKRTFISVLKHHLAGQEGSSLQMKFISIFVELMNRSDLTIEHREAALVFFCKTLHDLDPPLSALDADDQENLAKIDNPGLSFILSPYLPSKTIFPALISPFTGNWDDIYAKILSRWVWSDTNITLSISQSSFIRAIILGGSKDLLSSIMKLFESANWGATEQTVGHWNQSFFSIALILP
jgi:hypothetical protein